MDSNLFTWNRVDALPYCALERIRIGCCVIAYLYPVWQLPVKRGDLDSLDSHGRCVPRRIYGHAWPAMESPSSIKGVSLSDCGNFSEPFPSLTMSVVILLLSMNPWNFNSLVHFKIKLMIADN
jgi:hypothetical protein